MDNIDISRLRADTALVWESIKNEPLAKGFVLIGGTALTMRIQHRVSEDLDFSYVGPNTKLPNLQLRALRAALTARGMKLQPQDNVLAVEQFLDSGLDLLDYQQDFVANDAVKISFVCFDPPMNQLVLGKPGDALRVATLDELFDTKVFACSERSKTRDWLDLYTLLTTRDYTMRQVYSLFERVDRLPAFNSLQMRLRGCKPGAADEGYQSLMDSPPDLNTMRQLFTLQLDQLECDLAAERDLEIPEPVDDDPVG